MTSSPHHRRCLLQAVRCLAALLCAWVVLPGELVADTYRSALYEFPVPITGGRDSAGGMVGQSVWMRVSNADRILDDSLSPAARWSTTGRSDVALFEFFVPHDAVALSLLRVRFRDRTPAGVLGALQGTVGVGVANDASHRYGSATAGHDADGITIDLAALGAAGGLCRGQIVGLMFQLRPGETIDSLVDQRLAVGDVRAEVELSVAGGQRIWAAMRRPFKFAPRAPAPVETLLVAGPAAVVSSGPLRSQSASHHGTQIQVDQASRPSADELRRKVLTFLPDNTRARAPPEFDESEARGIPTSATSLGASEAPAASYHDAKHFFDELELNTTMEMKP